MFKLIAVDAWVCTNPREMPTTGAFACQFLIGTNSHQNRTSTSFDQVTSVVRVRAFGKPAEFAYKHLTKGALCYVEGRFAQSEYTNDEGQRVMVAEVTADRIMLSRTSNASDLIDHSDFIERLLDAYERHEAQRPST